MFPRVISFIKIVIPSFTSFTFANIIKVCVFLQIVVWILFLISRGDKIEPMLISVASQQDFQKVGNGTEKLYVLSAHFHKNWFENQAAIVVVAGGLNSTNTDKTLFCRLYDENGYHYETVPTLIIKIAGKLPLVTSTYLPFYFICDISSQNSYSPGFISLVETKDPKENSTNLLSVNYKHQNEAYEFSLCSQPLINYEDPAQLIEWIEFNRLMGVQKFILYNSSIQEKTSCLIESYGDLIKTLPFTSPYTNEEMEYETRVLSLNDCLQRNKGVSKYLVVADIEDMIVPLPTIGNNYTEMLQNLEKQFLEQNTSVEYSIAAYRFKNGFFFDSWSSSITQEIVSDNPEIEKFMKKMKLSTQIIRQKNFTPIFNGIQNYSNPNYIVFPDRCTQLNVHNIMQSVNYAKTFDVEEDKAYSHHYTNCADKGTVPMSDWCKSDDRIKDNSGYRFVGQIAINIVIHLSTNAKHCNITV